MFQVHKKPIKVVFSAKIMKISGAAGSTNSTTGSTFFFLGAKRQKNRSRENAFARFFVRRLDFGHVKKNEKNSRKY